ncbi:MAG: tetratricopeptide repeat protein [Bacteroidia bacterium]|nr:tetratricopeptide repeat protein [Bacteroidia bacterium]MCX7651844.1 tetratricopeptide repeat protein [Bacteroidia bacterium]MDW8416006.1 tetratricopeptide repeat protein [Bacteroidia bacterium]
MSEFLTADIERQREVINQMNAQAYDERYNNTELTLRLALDAFEKARAIKYHSGKAWALRNIGIAYAISGRPDAAEAYLQEALALFERLDDMRGLGLVLSNLATAYHQIGKLDRSIEYYGRSIRYLQFIPDLSAHYAQALANLGSLMGELEQYDLALEYHQRALEIHRQGGNIRGEFFSMITLAQLFLATKDYEKSETHLQRAFDIATDLGEEDLVVRVLAGQAELLKERELIDQAIQTLENAEKLASNVQNPHLLANIYVAMADCQLKLNLVDKARENLEKINSLIDYVKQGALDYILPQLWAKLSELVGDYENAYKYHKEYTKRYIALQRVVTKNTLVAIDRVVREDIIGMQKEAQADIVVASRIQEALLHGSMELKQVFPESIYWLLPRSLVSGDFLWASRGKDGALVFIVADASGAGVSAAMLSAVAHTLLYEIITMRGVTDPGKVLSQLHKGLLDLLYSPTKASSAEIEAIQSEGLQIGVCTVLPNVGEVHYAGAQIPLWVYNPLLGWEQLMPDKRLIGQKIEGEKSPRLYTSTIIPIEKRWVLLFMTDGWERQVRASDGKRYGRSAVRDFLAKHPPQDLSEWLFTIQQEFDNWREGAAPTDDVLLAAVRV